jgi:hypothetical protein
MEYLLILADHERGGLLVVEGTVGLVIAARLLERDVIADYLDNVYPVLNLVYNLLWYSRHVFEFTDYHRLKDTD